MTKPINVVVQVNAPSVDQIRTYLVARGWEQQPYPRPEGFVYQGPPDDFGSPAVALIPAWESLADFSLRIEELMRLLSLVEQRPAMDILNDIKKIPSNGVAPSTTSTRPRKRPAPPNKK